MLLLKEFVNLGVDYVDGFAPFLKVDLTTFFKASKTFQILQ